MRTRALWASLSVTMMAFVAPASAAVIEYTTKAGDTCEKIALQFWGDPKRYDKLHELNPQLGPTPHKLVPGTILKVIKPGPDAQVTFVKNQVEAATPGAHPAIKGEPLAKGNKVSTLGASNAEVTFSDDTRLQLGEYTLVVILGGTSGKAALGKKVEDTTLVKGSLNAFLADGGAPQKKQIATPSGKVDFTSGNVKLSVDDFDATRLAVYVGKTILSNLGKAVTVGAGFGSKAEKGKVPTPPRPLPDAPTWSKPLPTVALTASSDVDVSGTFAPGTGKGPAASSFHVQLARDESFNDLIVNAEIPAKVTTFEARKLAPGLYFARVSGIDDDKFEGAYGPVAKVLVATTIITPPSAGQRATLDVQAGDAAKTLFCSLDGAVFAPVSAPIELTPLQPHSVKCAASADGAGAQDLAIAADKAGQAVVGSALAAATIEGAGFARVVTITVADATGAGIKGAKLEATATDGATVDAAKENGSGGYDAVVHLPKGVAHAKVHFTLNGVQGYDVDVAGGEAPPEPAVVPTRTKRFELGVFGLGGTATEELGAAAGVGLEVGARFTLGSGVLAVGLRPTLERHFGGTDHARTSTITSSLGSDVFALGLPIAYRFLEPTRSFHPYVGVVPQLLVARARETIRGGFASDGQLVGGREVTDDKVGFGLTTMIGAQLDAGPGAGFLELGYRLAPSHATEGGEARLRGFLAVVGFRVAL
jgi:hypothetical protein